MAALPNKINNRNKQGCDLHALPHDAESTRVNSWTRPPLLMAFPRDRIDIWRVRLDDSTSPGTRVLSTVVLSPDEDARAHRFHFEKDRLHFSRCRCALRDVLSRYVGTPAREIKFEYSKSGKPQLTGGQNPQGLQFNVSHSADLALVAVGQQRLGVDLEIVRPDVDTASLAERFFSPRERTGLRKLPDALRVAAFFACWTRKEAFLKATGDGLSFPLADFSVSVHPHLEPALEEIGGDTEIAKRWFLKDLDVGDAFRASVVTEGAQLPLDTYEWS